MSDHEATEPTPEAPPSEQDLADAATRVKALYPRIKVTPEELDFLVESGLI